VPPPLPPPPDDPPEPELSEGDVVPPEPAPESPAAARASRSLWRWEKIDSAEVMKSCQMIAG